MKKPGVSERLLVLCILLVPFAYAAYIYPSLPPTIPTHFNVYGKPDQFGDRSEVWFITCFLGLIAAGTYVLVSYLPRIDPKKRAGQSPALYGKIAMATVLFLSCISMAILHATQAQQFAMGRFVLPLIGVFFAVLGNYMHSIKPNYFVGFRTPWTLENEDNWRKTHQLVSKLWVPGGLLIALVSLVLPAEYRVIGMLALLLPMVLIPFVYSYLYFKKHQH